jgi:hypothetical protein
VPDSVQRTAKPSRTGYGPADLTSIVRGDDLTLRRGTIEATYPANSITMLVLAGPCCPIRLCGEGGVEPAQVGPPGV